MSVLGPNSGCTVKYNPLLQEFARASPSGTPSAKGLYLTVYPSSRPNTDTEYKNGFGKNIHFDPQLSNLSKNISSVPLRPANSPA